MDEMDREKTVSEFEKMGGTYIQCGDYLIPNLGLSDEEEYEIGGWGMRYRQFLKENHQGRYEWLIMSGKLLKHLAEVDQRARQMHDQLVEHFAKQEGVTEQMKSEDAMLWVKKMNNISNRATEIVIDEIFV